MSEFHYKAKVFLSCWRQWCAILDGEDNGVVEDVYDTLAFHEMLDSMYCLPRYNPKWKVYSKRTIRPWPEVLRDLARKYHAKSFPNEPSRYDWDYERPRYRMSDAGLDAFHGFVASPLCRGLRIETAFHSDVMAVGLRRVLVCDWDDVTVDDVLPRLRERVVGHPDESWEVHETPGGVHAYRTMTNSDPVMWGEYRLWEEALTQVELGVDPWYVAYCGKERNFYVRVAPKPGRLGDYVSKSVACVAGESPVVDLKCAQEYAAMLALKDTYRFSWWHTRGATHTLCMPNESRPTWANIPVTDLF